MGVTGQEDTAIADDVLKNAWALKGQSGHYFREAIATVMSFISRGNLIYSPDFPSFEFFDSHTISISPSGEFDGSITASEAVAALMLHSECSALTQLPRQDAFKMPDKLAEVMELSNRYDLGATINGMAKFGNQLGLAAYIREQMQRGETKPMGHRGKDITGGSNPVKTREQDSNVHGAQMARSLFLEASQLASGQLSK